MRDSKKIKFTNKLKNLGPKIKWFLFTEMQDYKLTSEYIDFICPDTKKSHTDPIKQLEGLVRQSLIREFSPEIENSRSFNMLVDAVMHKIQKKSLKMDEDIF